jgi:hypothetical protein
MADVEKFWLYELVVLVGLCTIVRGDNNNEVLLVSWYWYIFCLHVLRGVYVVGRVVTRQAVIGYVGRWDRIAVAIPTPPICQPTLAIFCYRNELV